MPVRDFTTLRPATRQGKPDTKTNGNGGANGNGGGANGGGGGANGNGGGANGGGGGGAGKCDSVVRSLERTLTIGED